MDILEEDLQTDSICSQSLLNDNSNFTFMESKTSYYYNFIFDPGKLYKQLIDKEPDELFTKQIVLSFFCSVSPRKISE